MQNKCVVYTVHGDGHMAPASGFSCLRRGDNRFFSVQKCLRLVMGAIFPAVKKPWCGNDHSPPSSTEDKKVWNYNSTSSFVFMIHGLIRHTNLPSPCKYVTFLTQVYKLCIIWEIWNLLELTMQLMSSIMWHIGINIPEEPFVYPENWDSRYFWNVHICLQN